MLAPLNCCLINTELKQSSEPAIRQLILIKPEQILKVDDCPGMVAIVTARCYTFAGYIDRAETFSENGQKMVQTIKRNAS